MSKSPTKRFFSYFVIIFGWHFLSKSFPSSIFPSPLDVFTQILEFIEGGIVYPHLKLTVTSVFRAFLASFLLGILLGMIIFKRSLFGIAVDSFLSLLLYIPSIVVIYIIIITVGIGAATVFLTVTAVLTPEMAILFSRAMEGLDKKLEEVAYVYHIPKKSIFLNVVIPQLAPTLLGMAKINLAVSWKLALVAEVFAQAKGVGYKIFESFSIFSIKKVLAWLIGAFAAFALLEFVTLKPFEFWIAKWSRSNRNDRN